MGNDNFNVMLEAKAWYIILINIYVIAQCWSNSTSLAISVLSIAIQLANNLVIRFMLVFLSSIFIETFTLLVTRRASYEKQELLTLDSMWVHFLFFLGIVRIVHLFSLALFVFVLCFVPNVAYVSWLSILDSSFRFL